MPFSPESLVSRTLTTPESPAYGGHDRIPQVHGWLRGLAGNGAAPEPVRARLTAAGWAGTMPGRPTSLAELPRIVAAFTAPAARMAALHTTELPADLESVVLRGEPTREEASSRAVGSPWRGTPPWSETPTARTLKAQATAGASLDKAAMAHDVLVRRSVTTAEWLTDFAEARLAADEDFTVRMLLAWHRPYAPAEVRQEAYATWTDPAWQELADAGRVPASGLARFADHERPYARLAALDDPATDAARLLADPSPTVRWWARRSRHLPWPHLRRLLETHPEDAAANPALPREVMHRLLDIAGVPPVGAGGR